MTKNGLPRLASAGLRLTLVGLGDVGGTLLTALKLLGDEIGEIGIYDPFGLLIDRYCIELGQVLGRPTPIIVRRAPEDLFDCDVFLFAASKGVPPVGAEGDVRMAQFAGNRELLKRYAKQARETGFSGLFCQISDPVDLLCQCLYWQSNTDENGVFDGRGLRKEQIVGFGLGVMAARAQYYARLMKLDPTKIVAFGPHGAGLVIANDLENYDDALSRVLTLQTVEANRDVRVLGFKPYIAPALSSACISLLDLLRGRPFYGAIPTDGIWFGTQARFTERGFEPLHDVSALPPQLRARIEAAVRELKGWETECRL
jgi:hypothetical protein